MQAWIIWINGYSDTQTPCLMQSVQHACHAPLSCDGHYACTSCTRHGAWCRQSAHAPQHLGHADTARGGGMWQLQRLMTPPSALKFYQLLCSQPMLHLVTSSRRIPHTAYVYPQHVLLTPLYATTFAAHLGCCYSHCCKVNTTGLLLLSLPCSCHTATHLYTMLRLQISRRELENIQQGKGKISRLHTKLSRLTQVSTDVIGLSAHGASSASRPHSSTCVT